MKKNHKQKLWIKKLKYYFDGYMEQGARAQFGLLFSVFFILICCVGFLLNGIHGAGTVRGGMWQTLMHLLDPGTITADDVENGFYLVVMLAVTVLGMVLTGALIAIMNTTLDAKLTKLRKGHSQIIEDGHTVVIGFDEDIYVILKELKAAYRDAGERGCVVVLDDKHDKEEMDRLITERVGRDKETRIICRDGIIVQDSIFERASLAHAKSIIINHDNDFQVLRILLAVTEYLKKQNAFQPILTTLLHDEKSIRSARYIVQDFPNARILYFEDMLARIMAQVCWQPGLSLVLAEVFHFEKNEFYIGQEDEKGKTFQLAGRTFADILLDYDGLTVVGIRRNGQVAINPPYDMMLCADDQLLYLAEEEHTAKSCKADRIDWKDIVQEPDHSNITPSKFLILDWNKSLPTVLHVLNDFVNPGSSALIVSDREYNRKNMEGFRELDKLQVEFCKEPNLYDYDELERILDQEYTNVLLVCEDGIGRDEADAQTGMLLMHLRMIMSDPKNRNRFDKMIITSEMNTADDQKLLQVANVNDFIVGSEIANQIMVQVSREPNLAEVFAELLDEDGSEIYLRSVQRYIKKDQSANLTFAQLTDLVYHYQDCDKTGKVQFNYEIPLGYKTIRNGETLVKLNPPKNEIMGLGQDDKIVVLSKGREHPFDVSEKSAKLDKHYRENADDVALDEAMEEIRKIVGEKLL